MKFIFYHGGINTSRTMVVDGVEECRVNLSHWPNNQTPEHLKADTSTEIALNLAVDPYADRLFENIEFVSNNHFDTDGLLSCWAAIHPHEALPHKEFLIRAAEAGDFGWFTTSEAVRFDLVVSAFEDPQRSPLRAHFAKLDDTQKYQLIYETLLGELPDLLYNFQTRYRELHEEGFARLAEARSALANGAAIIREYSGAGLSVMDARKEFPLTSRFNACRHDRLLTFTEDDGGLLCEFFYHIVTWFETRTLAKRPRIDLAPLVVRLNAMENGTDARWRFDSLAALYPRLAMTDLLGSRVPSRLSRELILSQFLEFFENAENPVH
ncbi:MAG: hypothetical protein LAO31_15790 [Acidobacteriia bacterium]|nr:hypothetical protein [Terriglobia bacterium]